MRQGSPPRRLLALAAAAATLALGLCAAAVAFSQPGANQGRSLAASSGPVAHASGKTAKPEATSNARKQMPRPIQIEIPAIGVSAPVVPLGLNPDGTLEVPADIADAGWFTKGPEPGETGAAVIAGHLNSRKGPGVFSRLSKVPVGAVIRIELQDRSTVRYVVKSMVRVPKSRFPTQRVYAKTTQPTLRLITCAGKLNWSTGHHLDNYIVFASIVR